MVKQHTTRANPNALIAACAQKIIWSTRLLMGANAPAHRHANPCSRTWRGSEGLEEIAAEREGVRCKLQWLGGHPKFSSCRQSRHHCGPAAEGPPALGLSRPQRGSATGFGGLELVHGPVGLVQERPPGRH